MKIVVCVRQGLDGEINPFDACAYETALQQSDAEVTLLSMGPQSAAEFLVKLTRLGAKKAVLLSDKQFAGADTLATAYTLSKALSKLEPDLVLCGRQTLVGDTGQVGPMLSVMSGLNIITNVMSLSLSDDKVSCKTRNEGEKQVNLPALLTVERINTLRLPSLRSKTAECEIWTQQDIGAEPSKCGLAGSPTRVLKTFENKSGKRKCRFISREMLSEVIGEALNRDNLSDIKTETSNRLSKVFTVGEDPIEYAKSISVDITVLPFDTAENLAEIIKKEEPSAVIWASDNRSKRLSSQVAAMLGLGLCADCTKLEVDGDRLVMYRPALSGSIIAKIESLTTPAMATVRTVDSDMADIVVAAGFGVKDSIEKVKEFAYTLGADLVASRKMVDNDVLSYDTQVGLTGKSVSPKVYIAIGVSGAVHHIAGMQRSGTVIAINPDKNAPIFDYADYGILEEFN